MDPITTAVVAALSAGAIGGLTEASKTAITDADTRLKDLLSRKFGTTSEVVQAIEQVEAKPESASRQATLQEEIAAAHAEQDHETLAAAHHLLALIQQQAGPSNFIVQNNAPIQGQTIGNQNQITQHFRDSPHA